MDENQQPPRRPGAWPTGNPVDPDATDRDATEREYGERYAELQAARAWNELVLDNIRIDLARQPNAACKRRRARWWITGVLNQLAAVLKEGDR